MSASTAFFDNDHAGLEALRQIRMEYGRDRYIRDASQIYGGCKDLNEYLQQQRAGKQTKAIRVKVLKQQADRREKKPPERNQPNGAEGSACRDGRVDFSMLKKS